MSARPERTSWRSFLIGGAALAVLLAVAFTALGARPSSPQPTIPPGLSAYLIEPPTPAPRLELTDARGVRWSLAENTSAAQLVFFGYTHCPDVCPETMGVIARVLDAVDTPTEASFVTVDPERDTVEFLAGYERYLPAPMTLLTGSPGEVRATADAWGVRYARVDRVDGSYSMSHTADVYLVDRAGMLRARFPFGTTARDMERVMALLDLGPAPTVAPTPTLTPPPTAQPTPDPSAPTFVPGTPSPSPSGDLTAAVVSTSVWAGPASPVILTLYDADGRIDDLALEVEVQLHNGVHAIGDVLRAVAVQPAGMTRVFYVAALEIPFAGDWQLQIMTDGARGRQTTTMPLIALHPAETAELGALAPSVRTPTLDDVGGVALRVTTDPAPDLRLSRTSTADALAAGQPFVLVVDSWRFQVSPACGKALGMARFMLDRWPNVAFIHLEPYRYDVVTSAPVLDGRLEDPPLVAAAEAWGLGPEPWDALSVPWVFVVDGNGTVVAKYQGLVGSEDVDVILAMLEAR
jgi:protein SCO1